MWIVVGGAAFLKAPGGENPLGGQWLGKSCELVEW